MPMPAPVAGGEVAPAGEVKPSSAVAALDMRSLGTCTSDGHVQVLSELRSFMADDLRLLAREHPKSMLGLDVSRAQ